MPTRSSDEPSASVTVTVRSLIDRSRMTSSMRCVMRSARSSAEYGPTPAGIQMIGLVAHQHRGRRRLVGFRIRRARTRSLAPAALCRARPRVGGEPGSDEHGETRRERHAPSCVLTARQSQSRSATPTGPCRPSGPIRARRAPARSRCAGARRGPRRAPRRAGTHIPRAARLACRSAISSAPARSTRGHRAHEEDDEANRFRARAAGAAAGARGRSSTLKYSSADSQRTTSTPGDQRVLGVAHVIGEMTTCRRSARARSRAGARPAGAGARSRSPRRAARRWRDPIPARRAAPLSRRRTRCG